MKNFHSLTLEERELVILTREAIDSSGITTTEIGGRLGLATGGVITHYRYGNSLLAQKHVNNFCELFHLNKKVFSLIWLRAINPNVYENIISSISADVVEKLELEIQRLRPIAEHEQKLAEMNSAA